MNACRKVSVDDAVAILRGGGLVALPTETVYGLGASALSPDAVSQVFAVKGRPTHHPLIVHLASADLIPGWAEMTAAAATLAERFWPGPLTLVLKRGPLAQDVVTGGLDTVGIRVPDHPVTLEVLRRFGSGVAAPSANRFGRISPTSAAHVIEEFQNAAVGDIAVLDGGPCAVGLESTIVDLTGECPTVLRLGAITPEQLEAALGVPVSFALNAERARAPGQLASHYAPRARLEVLPREVLAVRRAELERVGLRVVSLGSELGETSESWAKNLYLALRAADARGPEVILVSTPPAGALQAALEDRLARAAAPRR
jgi:L-threonylcarbamoyladenylate synthase